MLNYCNVLDDKIIEKYGNKYTPRNSLIKRDIRLFYDAKLKSFIPLPQNMNHIEAACRMLNVLKKDIVTNGKIAEHLVPILIMYKEEYNTKRRELTDIAIGASSLETGTTVKHPKRFLKQAKAKTLKFVKHYPKSRDFRCDIVWMNAY